MSILFSLFPGWAEKRRKKKALKRHGWDLKCSGCGRWMHAEECGRTVASTQWFWHYECDCGATNHVFLGSMLPLVEHDNQWGGQTEYHEWKLNESQLRLPMDAPLEIDQ